MRLRVDSRAGTKPGISDLKGPSPFSPKETRAWQIPKDALLVMFFLIFASVVVRCGV